MEECLELDQWRPRGAWWRGEWREAPEGRAGRRGGDEAEGDAFETLFHHFYDFLLLLLLLLALLLPLFMMLFYYDSWYFFCCHECIKLRPMTSIGRSFK